MYKIRPYMPEDFDVKPVDIMYSMPSYHNFSQQGLNAVCNGIPGEVNDPVKTIQKKQQSLIKSIKDLGSTLEALLQEMEKVGGPSSHKSKLSESTVPLSDNASKLDIRKDKDAKKEARKAAKMEAKIKVASGAVSTLAEGLCADSRKPWIIHEEERSTITGQSLTACLPSALTDFVFEKVDDLRLTATEADRPWVEALYRLGKTRNVAFIGDVAYSCPNASTTVTISFGRNFSAIVSSTTLTCRISVWKLLGAVMGLFSFKSDHSMHAIHQHRWLSKIDLVLSGKVSKGEVIREANQFLSQFDALGSQFRFGIADLVAKAVLIGGKSVLPLPNNVELWSKRVDSVL